MASLPSLLASLAPQLDCTFTLTVVQEPVRARMCGLGDRDRRPITPPLIVKLTCCDRSTGELIPVDDIDTSFLVISADLRTPDLVDANIVRHGTVLESRQASPSSVAPSVAGSSSASSTRSPSPPVPSQPDAAQSSLASPPASIAASVPGSPPKRPMPSIAEDVDLPSPPLTAPVDVGTFSPLQTHPSVPNVPSRHSPPQSPNHPPSPRMSPPSRVKRELLDDDTPINGHASPPKRRRSSESSSNGDTGSNFVPYAREHRELRLSPAPSVPNLIGTLHSNGTKLKDTEGETGVYFVLPDLSVRTEGQFRMRLRLLSIGYQGTRTDNGTAVVASTHTQPFTVSSAKRFEGMMDPTKLSQCFAKQGVRIPTRKVAKTKAKDA